uniref:Uncharacterized protein n=1 Tax=Rhizophora mucronata TaxID=61149 RepID=A0A2P2PEI0_RHIMU
MNISPISLPFSLMLENALVLGIAKYPL